MNYHITKMEEGYLLAVIKRVEKKEDATPQPRGRYDSRKPLEEKKTVRESKSYAVSTLQELLYKINAFETGEQ